MTAPLTPSRRILVVEDSPTQAAALANLLEDAGYDVAIARTGERAVELVRSESFDLVLSDVLMPGISGYEVCRRIKTELGKPELPVVLLTSLTDPLDIVRGLEAGADNYVTKPYQPERLLARLTTVLETSPHRHTARGRPVRVAFQGVSFSIAADKEQIVELLVSSYEDLVRTSEAVRSAEQRARFLAEVGELLSSSLDSDVILRHLASVVVPTLADVCIIDALDEDGRVTRVDVIHADRAADRAALLQADTGSTPALAGSVMATREPSLTLATPEALAALPPNDAALLTELGLGGWIVVPLVARGSTLGVLFMGATARRRQYGHEDLSAASDLARRAALAVDNARLYHDARQATRARDDVLAIVSHDLRNPLHTIRMSASLLLDSAVGAEQMPPLTPDIIASQIGVINRAASRANSLIQDLLDVSRVDAGSLAVAAAPTAAAGLLDDAATEMGPLAQQKRVRLEHRWEGPPATVLADRERVAQMFSNLVGNALKFTRGGGLVTISGRVVDGSARYSVADTGAGIPVEQLPHIFDRFWQANRTTRTGAGLGLSITKGIVEAHGGTIVAESAVGVGTTFHFTLPLAPE